MRLRRFPVDRIKIAQAFVIDLSEDPRDAAIVQVAINLAHILGIPPAEPAASH